MVEELTREEFNELKGKERSDGWANGYVPVAKGHIYTILVDRRNGRRYLEHRYRKISSSTGKVSTSYCGRETYWLAEKE